MTLVVDIVEVEIVDHVEALMQNWMFMYESVIQNNWQLLLLSLTEARHWYLRSASSWMSVEVYCSAAGV